MSSALPKLQWSIQHRGLIGHPFDLEHGTDTGGLISGGALSSGHPSDRFIEGYAAVPPSRLHNILARWQASNPPHELAEYTFVDIGCGKGRALLLASEIGFREVVGVELNPGLAANAQAMDRSRQGSLSHPCLTRRRCRLQLAHGSMRRFSIQPIRRGSHATACQPPCGRLW